MSLYPFLSQLAWFSFNFAPKGWAMCNGQLLPINQNQALFSLLGTTYGGNGQTNFALPNLRGQVAIGFGQAAGLSSYALGQTGGVENVTVGTAEMASHGHALNISGLKATASCNSGSGDQQTPPGNVPAGDATGVSKLYSDEASPLTAMRVGAVALGGTAQAATTGGGQSHQNVQPYLVVNVCIALQGIFPSQN